MIKYNNSNINGWFFGDDNIIKVYKHDAIVFYKFDSESQEFKVCFAVVDDITQYSDREFEDVYDKATDKWFKLNNLNQYEEYGVYASGRNITYYNGKLTVDEGYEYEWNGSSWVNLGEVSGSSKTSDFQIGDIKERVTTGVSNGDYLLFSYYRNSDISKPENIMSYNPSNNYLSNLSGYGITTIYSTTIIDPSIWLLESTASANTFYIKSIKNNMYWGYQNTLTSRSLNLVNGSSSEKAPVLITPSCKANCYGFVEKKSNASTGYGGYGLNQLYSYTYQLNWLNSSSSSDPCTFFTTDGNSDFIIYKMNASDMEYPKNYEEKSEPLDNLNFNTMEDAVDYAYNNCVYDGMKAVIAGDRYYFDSTDENGWVEDTSYTIWLDPSATNASFSIGHYWGENYKIVFTTYLSGTYSGDYGSFWQAHGHTPIELSFYSNGFYYDMHNPTSTTAPDVRTTDYDYRILRTSAFSNYQNSQKIKITLTYGSFKAELEETGAVIYSSGSTRTGFSWYDGLYQVDIGLNNANAKCHLSHIQVYNANDELVNDLKFIKNSGVVGAQEISLYDSITKTTYNNTNSNTPVYHIET